MTQTVFPDTPSGPKTYAVFSLCKVSTLYIVNIWCRAGITASHALLMGSHVNPKADFSIHRQVMTPADRTYARPNVN